MAVTLKSLGIDQLGVDERLALIEALWDSISADESAIPVTDAQRAELDRRLAEHEANPNDVVSWDEVRSSLNQRLKR
ncbi:MAG: addiction module protein [Pseudomonadota bacterium]|jgi:putative addiction module component (TIGR02574 family)